MQKLIEPDPGVCSMPVYLSTTAGPSPDPDVINLNCSGVDVYYDLVWSGDEWLQAVIFLVSFPLRDFTESWKTPSFFDQVNSLLCNFVPCCALAGLTVGLVCSLQQHSLRRRQLLSNTARRQSSRLVVLFAFLMRLGDCQGQRLKDTSRRARHDGHADCRGRLVPSC